jgi:uncharacterized protein
MTRYVPVIMLHCPHRLLSGLQPRLGCAHAIVRARMFSKGSTTADPLNPGGGDKLGTFDLLGGGSQMAIEHVTPEGVVVNGMAIQGSVLILPQVALMWTVSSLPQLTAESLELLFRTHPKPGHVIFGVGESTPFTPPLLQQMFRERGIVLECLSRVRPSPSPAIQPPPGCSPRPPPHPPPPAPSPPARAHGATKSHVARVIGRVRRRKMLRRCSMCSTRRAAWWQSGCSPKPHTFGDESSNDNTMS